jgi:hypothetical protein
MLAAGHSRVSADRPAVVLVRAGEKRGTRISAIRHNTAGRTRSREAYPAKDAA